MLAIAFCYGPHYLGFPYLFVCCCGAHHHHYHGAEAARCVRRRPLSTFSVRLKPTDSLRRSIETTRGLEHRMHEDLGVCGFNSALISAERSRHGLHRGAANCRQAVTLSAVVSLNGRGVMKRALRGILSVVLLVSLPLVFLVFLVALFLFSHPV